MKRKKEDYVVIALGVILVIIILVIAVITANFSRSSNQTTNDTVSNSPTPTNIKVVTSPTPDSTQTRPGLSYDKASNEKLLDLMRNRRPISNADRLAKAKILTLLPQGQISGVLHETRNIRIDYVHSADLFQVEIITTDIKAARAEANVWFREQGLSQVAICTLPVNFYVSYDVANQLRDTDIVVSALGNGCI